MRFLKAFTWNIVWFYALPVIALAHETGEVHTEPPASVDPAVAVIVVIVIAVLAFFIWKFVLKTKKVPPPKST